MKVVSNVGPMRVDNNWGGTDARPRIIVVEQTPVKRTIRYGDNFYFVSLPKVRFEVYYTGDTRGSILQWPQQPMVNFYRLCFQAFTKNDEKIICPILPNTQIGNGVVCMGTSDVFPETTSESLAIRAVSQFWSSRFTAAISEGIKLRNNHFGLKGGVKGYFESWRDKTKADPKWIPDEDFFRVR